MPGLTLPIAATAAWALATLGLWRSRRWLLFFLTGGLGFTLLVLFWASTLGADTALEAIEAQQSVWAASLIGIPLSLLGETGLAIPNHTGWAVFDIGIECSALLEMSAIVGLTLFYPAFSNLRKARTATIGAALTYGMNIALINAFGTSWVFAAHAVFGRMLFFVGTVAIYWWLITRPTVARVATILGEAPDG
jgi:exosortase/archaeosortase family protein